ncbi:MAG: hypothetical protein LAN71_17305, partial [Acidobacteriia bacterium]|nr:hypothetical protein [Terriglobia bacterium]
HPAETTRSTTRLNSPWTCIREASWLEMCKLLLRLLFILNKHGFPMLNIAYEKRAGYYSALERSQTKKDEMIFLQWFFKRYLNENTKYLKEESLIWMGLTS